ncbi:MAG: GAF domain-containing SpoIIE family protein phosphatase [Treponema sp.]|nr:GAF domain-containing SpoIIE family protein phosphatase [Treponema sp.]
MDNLSIDSFLNIPILTAAACGIVLFILLLIAKIRNTARVSIVAFLVIGVTLAGLCYSTITGYKFYFLTSIAASAFIFVIYAFVLAVANPQKRSKKLNSRKKETVVLSKTEADQVALAENSRKYEEQIKTERHLIEKASGFFNTEDGMTSFLDYFNRTLCEQTASDGCAILLLDDYENVLAIKSFSGTMPPPYKLPEDLPHKPIRVETNFKFSIFSLTGNTFGDIFSAGEPVNITDPQKDKRIFKNGPEDFLKCGPYLFVPMIQNGVPFALICLSRAFGKAPYSQKELERTISLSQAGSTAIQPLMSFLNYAEHAELTKEGDIATKYQKTMLPEKMPVINKLSIGKYSEPYENVCGDFFDIIPFRKDRISFVMADIAGKGMISLMLMAMIRAMIRLVANTNKSAATIIDWINIAICSEKNSMDHFASVALINYDSVANKVQIATCGNNPVLLYSAESKTIKKISTESEPLGVDKATQYKDIDLDVKAGDIIVSCTDGLIECLSESGTQYSLENLNKVIQANCSLSGKDIAAKVKDNLKKFCGNAQQYDDQSLLVIKIQG